MPGAATPVSGPVPGGALAASGHAVPARVERLLDPPGPAAAVLFGLALALASATFILAPALLAAAA